MYEENDGRAKPVECKTAMVVWYGMVPMVWYGTIPPTTSNIYHLTVRNYGTYHHHRYHTIVVIPY